MHRYQIKNNRAQASIFLLGVFLGICAAGVCGLILLKGRESKKILKRFEAAKSWKAYPDQGGFQLVVASSLDRIFQDGNTLVKPEFSDTAVLSAAGNEYESFQVAVKNGAQELHGVELEVSDLVNDETQARIESANVSWRVVGYVPTRTPYYPTKYVGPWPDPLIEGTPVDIAANTVQPFWVTVTVPFKTPAGIYKGVIYLRGKEVEPRQIPVELTVYDFDLPRESHLKTAFDFYGHVTSKQYRQGSNEGNEAYRARISDLNERYTIEMLKYRMNPILNIDPTDQSSLGVVDRYRWFGLNNFAIGKKGGTFNNNWPQTDGGIEALLPLYRTYGENLKFNKMLDMHYIYTWDEGKIGNPKVPKICSMIHRAYPGLKNMVCYHGFWDPDSDPEWGKDIDIWTFQVDKFNEKKMRRLQEVGKEIWMYISGPSGYTTPNLAMDFDSIDYRIVPWLCWKYDIKGFLYWCVNWWVKGDPFKSAANSEWEQNGNGLLFYPGKDGPLVSLRMEIFRDGMEDYEYLSLLKGTVDLLADRGLKAENAALYEKAIKLLKIEAPLAAAMDDYTREGALLKERRNLIAQTIEELNNFAKGVVAE